MRVTWKVQAEYNVDDKSQPITSWGAIVKAIHSAFWADVEVPIRASDPLTSVKFAVIFYESSSPVPIKLYHLGTQATLGWTTGNLVNLA